MRSNAKGLRHVKSEASLVWESEDGRGSVLRHAEKIVKLASNLAIYGTPEDEVHLRLGLNKMVDLAVPLPCLI